MSYTTDVTSGAGAAISLDAPKLKFIVGDCINTTMYQQV